MKWKNPVFVISYQVGSRVVPLPSAPQIVQSPLPMNSLFSLSYFCKNWKKKYKSRQVVWTPLKQGWKACAIWEAQALLEISLHLSDPVTDILFLRASSPLVSRKGNSHEIKYHSIWNMTLVLKLVLICKDTSHYAGVEDTNNKGTIW